LKYVDYVTYVRFIFAVIFEVA